MRVAVAGGTILEAELARRATAMGAQVLGVGPERPARWPERVDFRTLALPGQEVEETLAAFRPDVVVHDAWAPRPRRWPRREHRESVLGARAVLRAAARAGAGRAVIWGSSMAYGPRPAGSPPLVESEPLPTRGRYRAAVHRARVERWLDDLGREYPRLELVVLRASAVPGRRSAEPLSLLLEAGWLPRLRGHDPAVQLLHPDDAVRVLLRALHDALPGTYNVAGDEVLPYSSVCRAVGRPAPVLPLAACRAAVGSAWAAGFFPGPASLLEFVRGHHVVDTGRLKVHFGYRPRHSTRKALEAWLRSEGAIAART